MKRAVPKAKKGREAKKGRKARKSGPSKATRRGASVPAFVARSFKDLIETCINKVADLIKPTEITRRSLFEYYGQERDEPDLSACYQLVCGLLRQTHDELTLLDIVLREVFASSCIDIESVCETQQRWLRPAIHVIRSVHGVLLDRDADHLDDMLPALRDMERGIHEVIAALEDVIQRCHYLAGPRAAR